VARTVSTSVIDGIPGWFAAEDQQVFRAILSAQEHAGIHGDVAELGVYLGRSAALIGCYVREDETFTVVDLFGADPGDADNRIENYDSYPDLTRRAFERNYRAVHDGLPVVIQGLSTEIRDRAAHGQHRFVHIDASHLYDQVREDVITAQMFLDQDGIVAFDDFRSTHTPGVAAAVWAAVQDGLVPLLVTESKLYGTWGGAERWAPVLLQWAAASGLRYEVQTVVGHPLIRVWREEGALHAWIPPKAFPAALWVRGRLRQAMRLLKTRD
jgi:hypothetical protein